ncbi:MAG: HAD-IA family hydrolase [Gemmatimonadetes bacterium]|jgi:HAD superfamily hydrolase (TIGR01509 family)|nr:HAD-IA family hydrolase [Gemmatimonadota bacterium]MBT6150071.1 HAD-IA family hydrolase [Gemmatimonadota bacterium]MBT7861065.1 HAD-IA family hydrolase [Gemmatimonadota bacterium]
MIHATLFDLMGTLLIEAPASPSEVPPDPFGNFHRVMLEAGLSMSREELLTSLDEIRPVAVSGTATPFEDRLLRVCERGGLSVSPAKAHEIAEEICSYSNKVLTLDPETIPAIRQMRQRGPVGLVSNYDHPPNVHHLLKRDGLEQTFDIVIISGELGVWKPDPGILLAATTKLEVDPASTVYVGDSGVDIDCAHAARMPSILIQREGGPSDPLREKRHDERIAQPDVIIGSLTELADAVAGIGHG